MAGLGTQTTGSAAAWGRVAADGTVYVRTPAGERAVGSWHAGSPGAGLAHFHRRYQRLVTQVSLLGQRVTAGVGDSRALHREVARLRATVTDAPVVGDLAELDRQLAAVEEALATRRATERAAAAARAAAAVLTLSGLVAEAEKLADGGDWKAAGDRFRDIGTEWRAVQGADRARSTELWRRFTAARTRFLRRRAAHFAELAERQRQARQTKQQLVDRAQRLAETADQRAGAAGFAEVIAAWRAAGSAGRSADRELWDRLQEARSSWRARCEAARAARAARWQAARQAREQLLAQMNADDPAADPARAGRRLREFRDRWAATGPVPPAVAAQLARRFAAAEERWRAADRAARRPDPATSPLVTRLRESVSRLEARAARARGAGRLAEAEETEAALRTQRSWLSRAEIR